MASIPLTGREPWDWWEELAPKTGGNTSPVSHWGQPAASPNHLLIVLLDLENPRQGLH